MRYVASRCSGTGPTPTTTTTPPRHPIVAVKASRPGHGVELYEIPGGLDRRVRFLPAIRGWPKRARPSPISGITWRPYDRRGAWLAASPVLPPAGPAPFWSSAATSNPTHPRPSDNGDYSVTDCG